MKHGEMSVNFLPQQISNYFQTVEESKMPSLEFR